MLKEHYLPEDYEMMADNLEQLHKSFMNVLEDSTNGDFLHMKAEQDTVNQSLKILQALNAKKLQRDEMIASENIRRGYF